MATAFEKIMMEFAQIKQFPIDESLMPLADPEATEEQTDLTPLGQLVCEHPGPVPLMEAPPKGPPSRK